jgi:hypothetical protein
MEEHQQFKRITSSDLMQDAQRQLTAEMYRSTTFSFHTFSCTCNERPILDTLTPGDRVTKTCQTCGLVWRMSVTDDGAPWQLCAKTEDNLRTNVKRSGGDSPLPPETENFMYVDSIEQAARLTGLTVSKLNNELSRGNRAGQRANITDHTSPWVKVGVYRTEVKEELLSTVFPVN